MREKALRVVGLARDKEGADQAAAMGALAARLEGGLQDSMQQLIAIHGLEGRAAAEVIDRVAQDVRVDAPVNEGKAALISAAMSGALTGVAADLATGGLSFGAGMLTGAVLGAFGGAGIARGVNTMRGISETVIRWDRAFLQGQLAGVLLRYLAVAHYGRGRGEWRERSYPEFWRDLVLGTVQSHSEALAPIWDLRDDGPDDGAMAEQLRIVLDAATRSMLDALYPGALDALARNPGATPSASADAHRRR